MDRILCRVRPVAGHERVNIEQARGSVLAQDLVSPIDSPPFANAAMDGYALRSSDTSTHCGGARFRVVGTSWAGNPYHEPVEEGQCVRIFTGAAVPPGTDAVVMQEAVQRSDDWITVHQPIQHHEFVRVAGRDLAAGQPALRKGKRLTAIDVGLIATLGFPDVRVHRRVRVSLLSTGDELRPPGSPLKYGEIYDSNRFALKAFLRALGVHINDLGALRDDPVTLAPALADASGWSDAIITIGGASVGDADHLVPTLRELGRVDLWKVAIKPGKPFAFGQIGGSYLFGLPGNPVSAIVTFLQLVRPVLLHLMGAERETVLRVQARAGQRIVKSAGRMEFQRAVFTAEADGTLTVATLPGQEADRQAALSAANCFVVLPAECNGAEAGDPVTIEPLINYL